MDEKDKYGFQTTSHTLVEKLARGEAWQRFCEMYYEPIRNKFNAINRKGGRPMIDEPDINDAIAKIFVKLKSCLQTSYDPKLGRLRTWLSKVVWSTIIDYVNEVRSCGVPLPEGGDQPVPEPLVDKPTSDDEEWVKFLLCSSFKLAATGRPWSRQVKPIIKVIAEERMERMRGEDASEDLSDKAIVQRFKITEENFRQIRSRFLREVRKLYEEFKNDDPALFEAMRKYNITPDSVLDECLQENGNGGELSSRREDFKTFHGVK